MAQYIDKSALVAEIERRIADNKKDIERASHKNLEDYFEGYEDALVLLKEKFLDTLEVKEVDLELVIDWFDHIAQIADDRMTLTNQRMTDVHALDEIKCLAKNSSEFIAKHYKAQKGEEV